SHPSHKSFTKEEHRQAGELHDKMIDHYSKKKARTEREYHKNQSLAKHHSLQQTIHNQKGYKKEDTAKAQDEDNPYYLEPEEVLEKAKAEDDEFNIDYNSPDYQDELMKAMLMVEEAIHEDILSTGDIEILKARRPASEGEERTWGGKKWRKVGKKWKPVGKGDKKQEEDKPEPKHSSKDLGSHAENTSTEQLKKVIQEGKHPHHIIDAAKRELERRSGEEGAKKDKEEAKKEKALAGVEKRLNNALKTIDSSYGVDKIQSIEKTSKGNYFLHMMGGGSASLKKDVIPDDMFQAITEKYGIQGEQPSSQDKGSLVRQRKEFEKNKDTIKKKMVEYLEENLSTEEARQELGYDEDDLEDLDRTVFEDLADEWTKDLESYQGFVDTYGEDMFKDVGN